MQSSCLLFPGLLAAALASSTFAQGASPQFTTVEPIEMAPTAPTLSGFTKAAMGSATEDQHAELFVLASTSPYMGFSADIHNAVIPVMDVAFDVAFVPDGGASGGPALALAGARGIEVWEYNTSENDFLGSAISIPGNPVGIQVEVADIDATGAKGDLVCRVNARKRIIKIADPGGTQDISYFDHPRNVLGLVVLNWDTDAELELGLLTSAGLEIVELNGTIVITFSNALAGSVLAVVNDGTKDRVAYVTKKAGSDVQYLNVVDRVVTDAELTLGDLGVVAAAAGDLDGDGDDDLVLSQQADHDLLQLMYDGGFSLDPVNDYFAIDVGQTGAASGNTAEPVVFDYDRDGDQDVLFAVESAGEIVRLRNGTVDHTAHQPIVQGGEYEWFQASQDAIVRLEVEVPSDPLIVVGSLVSRVWRQADAAAMMDTVPHRLDNFAVAGTGVSTVEIWIEESYTSDAIFNIELTYLNTAQEDHAVTVIAAVSANEDQLTALGLGTPVALTEINVPDGDDEGAGTVCRPNLPCPDDDTTPPEEDAESSTNGPSNP